MSFASTFVFVRRDRSEQLARSLEDYRQYYATRGQIWERLALLKAWPVAGSAEVGTSFLKMVKPFVFGVAGKQMDARTALTVVREVQAVKDMIDAKMADRGHERRNVKLGIGGIREIEFLVQTIQVLAGRRLGSLLDRNTLGALGRFVRNGIMSDKDRLNLADAYVFLRDVEHKLQMVHDLQTHALPERGLEMERCAIRMGYHSDDRTKSAERLQADHERHTEVVNRRFRSLFSEPEDLGAAESDLTSHQGPPMSGDLPCLKDGLIEMTGGPVFCEELRRSR